MPRYGRALAELTLPARGTASVPKTDGGDDAEPTQPVDGESICVESAPAAAGRLGHVLGHPVPDDASLGRLIAAWPSLSPELRDAVLRVAGIQEDA